MKRHCLLFLMLLAMVCPLCADIDSGETTRALDGTAITYEYSSGRAYNVKFEEAGVSYRFLTGTAPESWWGPFPYQAMQVDDGLYFAAWFEQDYGDFVTLLINLDDRILHGSALLRAETVHFHRARIVKVERPESVP